jgi:hypothetical protein
MIEGGNFIVITHNLSISMKIENPRPPGIPQVETAGDGHPEIDLNRKVIGIPRGIPDILSWIKDEI